MGQNLKSKMKLSIILVFLTFALTIDAGPPGLYLKPAGPPGLYLKPASPPGLYLKPIDGKQLEQTRGGNVEVERSMETLEDSNAMADRGVHCLQINGKRVCKKFGRF